jgi:hypothetical protein
LALATTKIAQIISDADVFGQWVLEETTKHSNIEQSAAIVDDPELVNWCSTQGNLKWLGPKWNSIDRAVRARVITETDSVVVSGGVAAPVPTGITKFLEEAVRSDRAQHFSASKLAKYLNLRQADPLAVILADLSGWWAYERMIMFLSTWVGVFASNDAAPVGGSTHAAGDLTHSVIGGGFVDGQTNFTAENFIDACGLMGDREDDLGIIITHSKVRRTMKKQRTPTRASPSSSTMT